MMTIPTDDSKKFAITFLEAEIYEMRKDLKVLRNSRTFSSPYDGTENMEKDIARLQSVVDYLSEGIV